jgi:hypothetical protein
MVSKLKEAGMPSGKNFTLGHQPTNELKYCFLFIFYNVDFFFIFIIRLGGVLD